MTDQQTSPAHEPDSPTIEHLDPRQLAKLDKHWWSYPQLLKLNLTLLSALLGQATIGFDGSMLNGLQAVSSWATYFDHPAGARLGTMANGFIYGNIAALVFSHWLCERFGRRWPLLWSTVVIVVGTALQAASQTFAMFVVSRFIVGMGSGVLSVVSLLLLAEVSYPSHRGVITAMISIFWPMGALIAAAATYGSFQMQSTWGWRLPSLLQAALPLVQIVLVFFVPESPRWLVDRGRREEAERILVKYHGLGDPDSALVQYEFVEISNAIELEKLNKASKWSNWFSSQGNVYRLMLVIFLGFVRQLQGNALVSYYLVLVLQSIGITGSKNSLLINIGLQIWSIVVCIVVSLTVDRFGRRRQLLVALGIMFVAFLIWTICSAMAAADKYQNQGLSAAVLLMIFIFQGGSHIYSPAVYTLITEIPQYSLRSKASMLFTLVGSMASVFSGYVNPIAIANIGWKYYIVYVVLLAFDFCVIYLYLPETSGMSLEEVAGIFDGDDAIISWHGVHRVTKRERLANASRYRDNTFQHAISQKGAIEYEHVENS